MATIAQLAEKMEVENILAKWAAQAAAVDKAAMEALLAQQPGPGLVDMDLTVKKPPLGPYDLAPKKIKSPFGLKKIVIKPGTPIRYLNPSTSPEEKSTKSSPSMQLPAYPMDFDEDLY